MFKRTNILCLFNFNLKYLPNRLLHEEEHRKLVLLINCVGLQQVCTCLYAYSLWHDTISLTDFIITQAIHYGNLLFLYKTGRL